jgi:hypothetical protein
MEAGDALVLANCSFNFGWADDTFTVGWVPTGMEGKTFTPTNGDGVITVQPPNADSHWYSASKLVNVNLTGEKTDITSISNCENMSGWTRQWLEDTIEVSVEQAVEGSASIKIGYNQSNADWHVFTYTPNDTLNLTARKYLNLWVYGDDSQRTMFFTIIEGNNARRWATVLSWAGWKQVTFPMNVYEYQTATPPNLSAIEKIQIALLFSSPSVGSSYLYIDDIVACNLPFINLTGYNYLIVRHKINNSSIYAISVDLLNADGNNMKTIFLNKPTSFTTEVYILSSDIIAKIEKVTFTLWTNNTTTYTWTVDQIALAKTVSN